MDFIDWIFNEFFHYLRTMDIIIEHSLRQF